MSEKKRFKWAILGTGKIANRFAAALNNIKDEAELLAVGSRSQESADKFADVYDIPRRYVGYEAVVNDPDVDIVYIGTPGALHHQDVTLCLNAGKAVLCEKAMTLNANQTGDLINLARKKNLFLMEAMWTRFFPIHVKIQELIKEGAIGTPRGVVTQFSATAPAGADNRFWNLKLGASAMMDMGIYGLAFASQLFGEPEDITGVAHVGEAGFDYQSSAVIKYKGGEISTTMCCQTGYEAKNALLFGDLGKIVIDDPWYKPTSMTVYRAGQNPEIIEMPLNGFNGYEYEAREVMACLEAGKKESDVVKLDESLTIAKTIDALRAQWGVKFPGEE